MENESPILLTVKSEYELRCKKSRDLEKQWLVKEIFVQSKWDVEDFLFSLSLNNLEVDGRKDITNSYVVDSEIFEVFDKKVGTGKKTQPCEHLTVEECRSIWELYTKVHNHPPSNREYTKIFLKA